MTNSEELPAGLRLARTTDVFDNDTVPAGLLRAHRVADDVWGRLVVHAGVVTFFFEDQPEDPILAGPDESIVIPPGRPHHIELGRSTRFAVEFHRRPRNASGS
jgi:tellurite resistance-related uncharacterized protein